jgi:hypothetical protein
MIVEDVINSSKLDINPMQRLVYDLCRSIEIANDVLEHDIRPILHLGARALLRLQALSLDALLQESTEKCEHGRYTVYTICTYCNITEAMRES